MVYIMVVGQAIGKIVKKFEETGMITNTERPTQHRFSENIAIVNGRLESVASSWSSAITTILRHTMAYFAFRSKPTSIQSQLTIHNVVDTRRWYDGI